jgi:hypothetical protein
MKVSKERIIKEGETEELNLTVTIELTSEEGLLFKLLGFQVPETWNVVGEVEPRMLVRKVSVDLRSYGAKERVASVEQEINQFINEVEQFLNVNRSLVSILEYYDNRINSLNKVVDVLRALASDIVDALGKVKILKKEEKERLLRKLYNKEEK